MQDKDYKPVEVFELRITNDEILIRINPDKYSFAKLDRYLKLTNNEFHPDNATKTNK